MDLFDACLIESPQSKINREVWPQLEGILGIELQSPVCEARDDWDIVVPSIDISQQEIRKA